MFHRVAPLLPTAETQRAVAPAFLLKKPFNLGFKALPGREFNLRDLWFPMLGVCILSVGFSIPSLRVTTSEYPPRAATNTVNKQCWPGNPTSRPVNYSVNKSNMFLCFSQVCGGLQQRERLLQQAERMQVSKTSDIIDDGWCNRAICRVECQAGDMEVGQ